jgi:RNA polymerase sigma-70 factor (ECF subfamily)
MESSHSQSDLIDRIRGSEKEAFEELFTLYSQALIHFSRRFAGNNQAAENIVQDVFLRIWNNREKLNPGLNIKSYLYKAVKNQSLQYLRHTNIVAKSKNKITSNNPVKSPEDRLSEKELAVIIQDAIHALPPQCRMIFSMSKYDHLTYSEIAEIQNISIKTVETQMGRALKFLRKRLSGVIC